MTSCHLIPMWHEWNANADDIMMMWFTLYVNLLTSHWACASHMHVHGTCALNKNDTSMYLSHLACMQANSNLEKITALQFSGTKYPERKQEYAKHDSHCISQ